PVEHGREGYITGLQMLLQVESRLEWLPTLLLLPLSLVESVSRYIGTQTSRRPQWSAEVEMACRPEPGDPVNVGAEHNGPGRWRTVLANEPRAVYDAKNQYLKDANQKIRNKMAHNRDA
ncbi:hypothetical protein, partial [Mangrovibacter phragmitis]|uniref:hypothetical protein n=1 Tax=Mangrovibacter phragmitis TaxID=1691903 RepID=UPI002F90734B